MKKIKILHYIPGFDYGGIENLVVEMYKNIDDNIFEFDFLTEKEMGDTIKKKSGKEAKIYQIRKITLKGFFKYIINIFILLKNNKYDVIHIHDGETRIIVSILAKILGIKIRILHAHSAEFMRRDRKIIGRIFMRISKWSSNQGIACSKDAAKFMFGKKSDDSVMILNNGIDCNKFYFNNNSREIIRKKYNITNEIIIGNIARFSYLKNQIFLVELLKELRAIEDKYNFMVMFVGDGNLQKKVKDEVSRLGLNKYVIFTGRQEKTEQYLSAMDIFILPSLKEGFGIVGLEAQCSALKCLFSTGVPEEIKILKSCKRIDLDNKKSVWIEEIIKGIEETKDREISIEEKNMINKYEIKSITKEYEKFIKKFF